jgi:AraC family transcriptional regulator, regulatory protein of adaptative response / DNA-3-methyladenine glycosylase II
MASYAAVSTTGIYCRPACSGAPKRENVSLYGLAAAAESAGYRACKRCRPYRVPDSLVWLEGPELVCRAVQLILQGALDEGRESDLAGRVGVSARHLRRLFQQHLGVTPDGLARSARAHFARRLLDDTDLLFAQIAFASGFGSLRQFNRACREIFRESPTELRARRRKPDRLVADGGLLLRLPFQGPLDWPEMLRQLAEQALPGVESIGEGIYRRTIELEGDPGVLELEEGEPGTILLRAHLPHWRELIHVVGRARRILNLDLDLEVPLHALGDDPTIGPLVKERPGVRPLGTWDGFETGARAIVSQGVKTETANRALKRLVGGFGTPIAGLRPFALTHVFPSAAVLAGADLSEVGLSARKRRTLHEFAARVLDGGLALDGSVSLEQLVDSLSSIPGMARETAEYIAFRLGERDAFPLDLLVPAEKREEPAATLQLPAKAERWRPWRAVAATHLQIAFQPDMSRGFRASRPRR